MKVIAVIPARYASTRFPGKPLADILGKPMIWWVYNQVSKAKKVDEIYIATDDIRIKDVCESYNMEVIMTRKNHNNHIERIAEVSEKIFADYYICVNGDEPLVKPEHVDELIPNKKLDSSVYYLGAMRILTDPVEVSDPSKIKLILNKDNVGIYMTRSVAPFPKGTLNFTYKKYVGIECFTKDSLMFFKQTDMGLMEKIEDIDHLRFIENGKKIIFKEINSDSISVDTPKDLQKVIEILEKERVQL